MSYLPTYNHHNLHSSPGIILFMIFTVVISASCGTDALEISGRWQFEGLEGTQVNKIVPSPSGDRLALATTNGVFIYKNNHFTPAGLQDEEIADLVFLKEMEMLAAIRITLMDGGENSMFKTTDEGSSWEVFMGNYGGDEGKYTLISALAIHPNNTNHLFARGAVNVSQSIDGGQTWESIYYDWNWIAMNASLLKIDSNNPNIIWAGGRNGVGQPYLTKTEDGGASWENLWRKLQIFEDIVFSSTAYSIAIRPGQSSHLLLGLGVGVFRSTDLGESWESVFNEASVLTMANSPRSSRTIYASGINQQRTLFVLITTDFGTTWQTIEMDNSPKDIRVNDMIVVEQDGDEVLFLGTNKGVFSFRVD
jgi:photosystem II stability/assembly factor-like uncharacterized protein